MTAIELAMWVAGGLGVIWLMCFVYNIAFNNLRLGFIYLAAAIITAACMFGLIDGEKAAKQEQEKMEAPTEIIMYEENGYRVYEVVTVDQ